MLHQHLGLLLSASGLPVRAFRGLRSATAHAPIQQALPVRRYKKRANFSPQGCAWYNCGKMHKLENPGSPLTDDELRRVFEAVSAGETVKTAQHSLRHRDPTTVRKIHGVVSQFQCRGLTACSDAEAGNIADGVGYSTTVHYVQTMFLK